MDKLANPSLERRLRNKQGQTICARCRVPTTCTIMSMFSRDIICMDCVDLERSHPKFKEASLRERAASTAGDRHFPGIGVPRGLVATSKLARAVREAAAK
jgi:hypothetical protein